MKYCFLRAAVAIGLAASVVPASAGARFGGVSGYRGGRMVARLPLPARLPTAARVPGAPVSLVGRGEPGFAGRQDRGAVRRETNRFEPGRVGRPEFGRRRWRGLPIYAASFGTGYPYPPGNDYADAPPPPSPADFTERYASPVVNNMPMQPQTSFNPGPRIIYVHAPSPSKRPLPKVIYGIHPQPAFDGQQPGPTFY